MQQYLNLLQDILDNGIEKNDRTGTGTIGVFSRELRFDLSKGFPLLTTKKVHFKSIVHELLWFLQGDTNVKYLQENGVRIWNEWADENGDLGRVYGAQWRSWTQPGLKNGLDQIKWVVDRIKNNPNCRRQIVTAWNPAELQDMALPPCHCLFQFNVLGNKLHLKLYQRSCDTFLGVPFNIASYSLLLLMTAQVTGYEPGEFIWSGADVHIYKNHIDQVKEQLTREPKELPKVVLNTKIKDIFSFRYKDIELVDYNPAPAIKAEVSV